MTVFPKSPRFKDLIIANVHCWRVNSATHQRILACWVKRLLHRSASLLNCFTCNYVRSANYSGGCFRSYLSSIWLAFITLASRSCLRSLRSQCKDLQRRSSSFSLVRSWVWYLRCSLLEEHRGLRSLHQFHGWRGEDHPAVGGKSPRPGEIWKPRHGKGPTDRIDFTRSQT